MTKENLLEKALLNKLSEEERLVFDQFLRSDKEYEAAYDFEMGVKKSFELEERERLKKMLVNHQKQSQKKPKKWLWAAAAVFLIGISVIAWNTFQPRPQADLFAMNYEKFPNLVAPNTRADDDREEAFKAYDGGDYQKAFQLFADLSEEETASFYQSICLIELGEIAKAIEHLEALSFQNEYEAHRLWYLSLLYSKNNKKAKAEAIWKSLAAGQSVWRERAKSLLQGQ